MHRSCLYIIFLWFFSLSLHITPVLSSFITPNEIRELFVNDLTNFNLEASNWTASPPKKTTYIWYECGTTYIVGGYGVGADSGGSQSAVNSYYGRIYQGLAPHQTIYYSFQLWAIDSWDLGHGDTFTLYFSGTTIPGISMSLNDFDYDRCGAGGWKESVMTIQGRVQHISTTLDFRIYSVFNEDSENESLGIREVNFVMSDTVVPSNTICSPTTPNTAYRCPHSCADGTFWNGGWCQGCHSNCAKCYDYGADKCYSCAAGKVYDGSQCLSCSNNCATCYGGDLNQCLTCDPSFPYMFNKNTCLSACAFPLATTTGSICGSTVPSCVCTLPCPDNQYLYPASPSSCYVECKFPLEAYTTSTPIGVVNRCRSPCNGTDFMYWEASCRSNCDLPLQAETTLLGIKHCKFPCPSQTLILYWNGDCLSTCEFPLDYANRFNRAFCDYPCLDTEYLYNNGTCASTCRQWFKTNLVVQNRGKKFCYYPCQPAEHLYNNGACLLECDWRFRNYTLWKDQHCDYPCTNTQYLYSNGSCIASCDPRFRTRVDSVTGDKYCDYPCTKTTEYLFSNGSCAENCDHLFSPYYLWDEMYCDYPCQSNQYLLNNGTCVSDCHPDYPYFNPYSTSGLPLRNGAVVVEKYCFYPCLPNEYLYSNGTCLPHCQLHFLPSAYSRDKFCNYPCKSTEYLYHNGSCLSNCPSIFNSYYFTVSEKYCKIPCKVSDFIYPNGTCLASCLPPYAQQIYGADRYCIYPCSTTTVEYLYRDGSCQSSCLSYYSPRTEVNQHFCDYPCFPDHFLYYNHTCLSSCNPPFVSRVVNQENFCDHPCVTTTNFIYWNSTCHSTCPSPLQPVSEGTSKFCTYPCAIDQFLYWTGTCLDKCPFPLTTLKANDGKQYCNNPCSDPQYLAWNGTCLSQCSQPFRTKDEGLGLRCALPCENSEHYYYEDIKECKPTCEESSTLEQGIYLKCSPSPVTSPFLEYLSTPPKEPNTITYIMLGNPIKYLRYLNVKMSPRLERLALSQGKAPISLLYIRGVPTEIISQLSHSVRTRLLAQVDIPASFLVNLWPEILMLAILVFLAVIFTATEKLCKKLGLEELRVIIERFRVVFRWNIPVMLLSTSLGNVIFYSQLEFQTLNLDSAAAIISLTVCIIFIIAEAAILIIGYCVAPKAHGLKVNSLRTRSFKEYAAFLYKWQGIQVMYHGFTTHTKLSYYFFLFYTIRMAAPMLIAAYIPNPPLLQTILFLIISFIALSYLYFVKPLRKKITRVQFWLLEIFILIVNVGLLTLAAFDLTDKDFEDASIVIGDIIIVLSFCICIIPTVFLIIKLVYGGIVAFRLRKISPEQSKAMWVQLLFLPIQQAGMGYEQVQIARHSSKYNRIENLDTTRVENAVNKESSASHEDTSQTHLYNAKNSAKRMKVPGIFKSNIKQPHEKDYKPEYRTFAEKNVMNETNNQSLDPFSVTDQLPRKKRVDENIQRTSMLYSNVYAATKGFGRIDDL